MHYTLPFDAPLDGYAGQARELFAALQAGDDSARWNFKWMHPRFRGLTVDAVQPGELKLADAERVVAAEYAFDSWKDLTAFTVAVQQDEAVIRFETTVEAVISGDTGLLRALLQRHPELVRDRSRRRHRATLLHYIAANGVEGGRQRTPPNAVEIARILLEAGALPDALADMYENQCTTMSMLVSSSPPHEAGLQGALAEVLLDYEANAVGPGSAWQSALLTALIFGFPETAAVLAGRGAPVDTLAAAAGLGHAAEAERLLPGADAAERHRALALSAQLGQIEVVRLLLDAGEDPDRYNPDGFHSHSTPLHQAVSGNHEAVVQLLLDRGARLDIRDTIYQGTPLDWALYGKRARIAELLKGAAKAAGSE